MSAFSHVSRLLGLSAYAVLLVTSTLDAESAPGPGTSAGDRPELCQVASLRNGFTIRYMRHEVAGSVLRLWMCADAGTGYLDVPTEQIAELEQAQIAVPPAGAPETNTSDTLPVKDPIGKLIAGASSRYQIDPDFLFSVVRAESGFNPAAISPKGAQGLMQLMPRTAARLGIENVLDPAANVEGGTKYLRELLDRYDGDAIRALAAYNAGPQRVKQFGGAPPYPETLAYITRIIEDYNRKKAQQKIRKKD